MGDSCESLKPEDRSIQCVAQCFWDSERDTFATETVHLKDIFIVATVYVVYFN